MKLSVINGSPRGESSNSTKILKWISKEDVHYIKQISRQNEVIETCADSDAYLICFPLYVDSMPAQQKKFFELMEENRDLFTGKSITFIIHSGFPEMVQSMVLKEYLELFCAEIMGMNLLGVIIIGGSEALQMAPDNMFSRQIKVIEGLAKNIENQEKFPEDINIKINRKLRLTRLERFIFSMNPLKNFYWNYRASRHTHKVNLKAKPHRVTT
ncbi:MAG: NAD(P)H-dependent oxidoreductase [Spirochaetaceae bacterium]